MDNSENKSKRRLPIDVAGLWQGCMLALSVHAVMLVEYPFISDEQMWLDGLYLTMNHEGAKAALVFTEEQILMTGLFREFSSERTELALSDKYAKSHFKAAPDLVREMTQGVIPLFEEKMGEKTLPVVTTGFWSEEDGIYSRDSFEDWYEQGGFILQPQLMPFDEAMAYYQADYDMDDSRAEVIERVYKEKIQSPNQDIILSNKEIGAIMKSGDYNREACQVALGRFGVFF